MVLNIALQFHPDWPYEGQMVFEGMAETGQYRSQFQTGISNGGMTALTGDRCRWESRLCGGRYDRSPNHERPVYGAVDLGDPRGPASRFGSAFVRLRPEVGEQATFCYPDSAFEPDRISHESDVASLVARMRNASADALDRYVEAHVHGGVVEIDHGDNTVCVSEILECDASSRRLRLTWEFPDEPTSQVTFAVVAGGVGGDGESSELRLHHENLGVLVDEYRDGWRTHLTYFAASLAGEPLAMREFWNVHEQLVEQGSRARD